MTALQVLKELKKEKWPDLKTGEYNLPLILAAMHKFAELRQCNVIRSGKEVCPKCSDLGWIDTDEHGGKTVCPCHFV
jgi:hypothetical protein